MCKWFIGLVQFFVCAKQDFRNHDWMTVRSYFCVLGTRFHRGHDHMVVEFATTDAISTYHHFTCEFDTLVFSTNETDCHDMTEILLKVALSTITLLLRD